MRECQKKYTFGHVSEARAVREPKHLLYDGKLESNTSTHATSEGKLISPYSGNRIRCRRRCVPSIGANRYEYGPNQIRVIGYLLENLGILAPDKLRMVNGDYGNVNGISFGYTIWCPSPRTIRMVRTCRVVTTYAIRSFVCP